MKKVLLTTITIMLAICMVLSISYAYYMINPNKDLNMTSTTSLTSCMSISLLETNFINLSGDYAIPIQDERVLNSSVNEINHYKYSFTINNECGSVYSNVTLAFVPTSNNTMPLQAIKYLLVSNSGALTTSNVKYLYNNNKVTLSQNILSDANTVLDNIAAENNETNNITLGSYGYTLGTINVSSSVEYRLYMWIDYDEGGLDDGATTSKVLEGIVIMSNYSSLS